MTTTFFSLIRPVRISSPLVGTPVSPAATIHILPTAVSTAVGKAQSVTSQWTNFKSRLDTNLKTVIFGNYEGSGLTWIADYALGYRCLKSSDPTTASYYADKAMSFMRSALNDRQGGATPAEQYAQYVARGDGTTTAFTINDTNIITSSLTVYLPPIRPAVSQVKGSGSFDTLSLGDSYITKISNTNDGTADYVKGVDWQLDTDQPDVSIQWIQGGNAPVTGATYYCTPGWFTDVASHNVSASTYTWNRATSTITFNTAPTSSQYVVVSYVANDGITDDPNHTHPYYRHSSGNTGGYNNIFVDQNYTGRYLGLYLAIGEDWLQDYVGYTGTTLQSSVRAMLQRWFDYIVNTPAHGYSEVENNYGAGEYVSNLATAVVLAGEGVAGGSTNLTKMTDPSTGYRATNVLPKITPTTQSLYGGAWAEGWNYGPLAISNILRAAAIYEQYGLGTATAERTWAGQVARYLMHVRPARYTYTLRGINFDGSICALGDGSGDYPVEYATPDVFYWLTTINSDNQSAAYAVQELNTTPSPQTNDANYLMLYNPAATATDWTVTEPLSYYASGYGVLHTRTAWDVQGSPASCWIGLECGILFGNIGHQLSSPGSVFAFRGKDDVLGDAQAYVDWSGAGETKSMWGNCVRIDAGKGNQAERYSMSTYYGLASGTTAPHFIYTPEDDTSDGHVYALCDYKSAWSISASPGTGGPCTEGTRSLVYFRKGISGGNDYLLVYDRVTTSSATAVKQQSWTYINQTPPVTGGTWSLSVQVDAGAVQTATGLAYNITSAALTSAIAALSNVGAGNVAVSSLSSAQGCYVVDFTGGTLHTHTIVLTADGSGLIPTSTITLEDTQASGTGDGNTWNVNLAAIYSSGAFNFTKGTSKTFTQIYAPQSTQVADRLMGVNSSGNTFRQILATSTAGTAKARFLAVIQFTDSTTVNMDTSSHITSVDNQLEGVLIGQRLTLFAQTTPLTAPLTYSFTGTNATTIYHLICDLSPNTIYTVTGATTGSLNSSSSGTLKFSSTATGSSQTINLSITAPSAPTGLNATSGNSLVNLSWNSTVGAITYNIYRSTTTGTEVLIHTGVSTTSYNDTGLTNGTTYFYKVSAVNTNGESTLSSEVSAQPTAGAPSTPTNVTALAGNSQVLISWNSVVSATTYNIYRSTTSGTETLLTSGVATNNYNDTSLTNGTTYFYKVSAVNTGGESALSSEVNGTPLATLAAPTGLVTYAGNNKVSLLWNSVVGATSYNIYRSTSSGTEALVATSTHNYYNDLGLTNNITYYYKVTAANGSDESPLSAEVSSMPFVIDITPSPAIKFQVKLYNWGKISSYLQPDSVSNVTTDLKNATIQIPGISGNLRDGDTFTLYGYEAIRVSKVYSDSLVILSIN